MTGLIITTALIAIIAILGLGLVALVIWGKRIEAVIEHYRRHKG